MMHLIPSFVPYWVYEPLAIIGLGVILVVGVLLFVIGIQAFARVRMKP